MPWLTEVDHTSTIELLSMVDLSEAPPRHDFDFEVRSKDFGEDPIVSIIIIRGRRDNPYWDECYNSAIGQVCEFPFRVLQLIDYDHHLTLGGARTYAAKCCGTKYAFFLDDDDILVQGALQDVVSEAVSLDADRVVAYMQQMTADGVPFGPEGRISHIGLVNVGSYLDAGGSLRINKYEDTEFIYRFSKLGYKSSYVPKTQIYYRRHDSAMTSSL